MPRESPPETAEKAEEARFRAVLIADEKRCRNVGLGFCSSEVASLGSPSTRWAFPDGGCPPRRRFACDKVVGDLSVILNGFEKDIYRSYFLFSRSCV